MRSALAREHEGQHCDRWPAVAPGKAARGKVDLPDVERGRGGCGDRARFLDARDEAEAASVDRANDPLRLAVIANDAAGGLYPGGHRAFRYDAPVPDLVDDLVLRDHAFAISGEEDQQREYLRLDMDALSARAQLETARIQLEPLEPEDPGIGSCQAHPPFRLKSP